MDPLTEHEYCATVSFDGGDLDCGNGLLLLIRKHLDPLDEGQLLEIRSTETSVEEDLPAWCRLTSNDLVSWTKSGKQRSYLVCRGKFVKAHADEKSLNNMKAHLPVGTQPEEKRADKSKSEEERADISVADEKKRAAPSTQKLGDSTDGARANENAAFDLQYQSTDSSPSNSPTMKLVSAFDVIGVGSWPRPSWLMPYLHKFLEHKISEHEFIAVANDAVKLAVQAQESAGVNFVSDGECKRDNYASFVGHKLEGCQLIPLTDLLPLVDDPEKFQHEMQSLDVPAEKVRHPAVLGRLSRKSNIAVDELRYLSSISRSPLKVALPGPYLLTRLMWMDCITDKVYETREELSESIVKILREEIADLLAHGASLVQLDEPVLTEVVFTGPKNTRSFMCGALSERGASSEELEFAANLINAVLNGFPKERLAMHVCRGNWTPDESRALSGDYTALLPLFNQLNLGRLILEFCTPRAGDLHVLENLREDINIGLGVINPKAHVVESVDEIVRRVEELASFIDIKRISLNPDCGFATFADSPVNSSEIAQRKLQAAVAAAKVLKQKNKLG